MAPAKLLAHLRSLALIGFLAFTITPVLADIPASNSDMTLHVDGAIDLAGAQGRELDIDFFQSLPAISFTTTTIWTEGAHAFTGVALKTLIESLGGHGDAVVAEALNGYAVEIPFAELADTAPIVAYFIDGKPLSRRDKGPFWVVFPYDLDRKYKSETAYTYSIWQLRRLTVK